jgi:hypothetical protein
MGKKQFSKFAGTPEVKVHSFVGNPTDPKIEHYLSKKEHKAI